jgi:hypothetical protein
MEEISTEEEEEEKQEITADAPGANLIVTFGCRLFS